MSVQDYQSRRYDVMAFQGVLPPGKTALLEQALASSASSGSIATGVQKAAQKFVLELLTSRGSWRFLPEQGTDFIAKLKRGELRTELDIFTAFNFAATRIIRKLQADQESSDPDDERIRSASLDKLALSGSTAKLFISISTAAGDTRQVILPIEVIP